VLLSSSLLMGSLMTVKGAITTGSSIIAQLASQGVIPSFKQRVAAVMTIFEGRPYLLDAQLDCSVGTWRLCLELKRGHSRAYISGRRIFRS
jgi:hypothetical protein